MTDNQRLELDIRNLPPGLKPKLHKMAKQKGLTMTGFIRSVLVHFVERYGGKP